jgi:hypothetical protein
MAEELAGDLAEGRDLFGVERMIEALGAGEVAHHQRNAVIAGIDPGHDALRFHQRQAEPVHAGIDMNRGTSRPSGAPAEHVPLGKLVEIADHGLAIDFGESIAAVLKKTVEHVDFGRRQRFARGARFIQGCHEKRLAAGGRKRARHRFGAAAIGIGLDHGGAFGRYRGFLELAPVRDNGVEIDGENAGRRGGCGGERCRGIRLRRQQAAGWNRFQIGNRGHAALYARAGCGSTVQARVSKPARAGGCPARDR